jgi:hypothetical protein
MRVSLVSHIAEEPEQVMVDRREVLFGTMAVEMGFITTAQLGKAVGIQMKMDLEKGIHKLLGQIVVEMGFMTISQVEEALQAKKIA